MAFFTTNSDPEDDIKQDDSENFKKEKIKRRRTKSQILQREISKKCPGSKFLHLIKILTEDKLVPKDAPVVIFSSYLEPLELLKDKLTTNNIKFGIY